MSKLVCITAAAFAISAFAEVRDLPDPKATPGVINPNVTQATINKTICVPGWTKTIRPPVSYTNNLKRSQLAGGGGGAYAAKRPMNNFEEDHLISLELGGAPRESHNLWPQHWSSPHGAKEKDALENKLHRLVCNGEITLEEAQTAIRTDWIAAHAKYVENK